MPHANGMSDVHAGHMRLPGYLPACLILQTEHWAGHRHAPGCESCARNRHDSLPRSNSPGSGGPTLPCRVLDRADRQPEHHRSARGGPSRPGRHDDDNPHRCAQDGKCSPHKASDTWPGGGCGGAEDPTPWDLGSKKKSTPTDCRTTQSRLSASCERCRLGVTTVPLAAPSLSDSARERSCEGARSCLPFGARRCRGGCRYASRSAGQRAAHSALRARSPDSAGSRAR